MKKNSRHSRFRLFARFVSRTSGRPVTFLVALGVVLAWAITGPIFHFSDTWQLVINTGTTIITFLMVFVIQHTQNRDTDAIQVKLDELIRATHGAHNALLDLEDLEQEDLDRIRAEYESLASRARSELRDGKPDTGMSPVQGYKGRTESEIVGKPRTPGAPRPKGKPTA